jgi:hypothetical protein
MSLFLYAGISEAAYHVVFVDVVADPFRTYLAGLFTVEASYCGDVSRAEE